MNAPQAVASSLLSAMAISCVLAFPAPTVAAEPRPNVLFIIADDWSYPHAGVYGDRVVMTPNFDRLAREGALFRNSFCASPSCTPSRGAILTGQAIHRLEEGGNLWSTLPTRYRGYADLLEAAGYFIGLQGKGWGPGSLDGTGRTRNPAGPNFRSFQQFLQQKPSDRPFCFWFGSTDPHRPYDAGSGAKAGLKLEDVSVPLFLPDTPVVRSDILDYYLEVQRFDLAIGSLLRELHDSGLSENTLVIVTSDNGMPFPRAKANLYDAGTHMPLAIRWPAKLKPGRVVEDFVSHCDLAPTILDAVGLQQLPEMTGRSLLPMMLGEKTISREVVYLGRERHANVRKGDQSFPSRAIRTKDFLFIRNFRPERWPAGDPELWKAVGPFGDIDGSPSKDLLLEKRNDSVIVPFFQLACARRPAEELYDLRTDPHQIVNVAERPEHRESKAKLRASLDAWLVETGDPRSKGDDDRWDRFPYFGSGPRR